ncbi:PH domain-containing protein [Rhodopirellula sp. JC740]|uniref:PH domain-containing protein n=1 Tax=Rhodopirellula halodulae TaxID=2894198 RepID=A0ABS8NBQ6_9BACT|nr:PH domain-containing protein [Rhodopirellula sp. JC740]MCC9641000.1 PH domain-containing protein [Rhodopirellula sp. JC740]
MVSQLTEEEATLTYRCPMCEASVRVDEHRVGETIDCPSCDRPFELVPPKAHPIPAEQVDAEHVIDASDVAETEAIEHVVHPVVLRRHFFGTLLCLVILSLATIAIGFALLGEAVFGFAATTVLIACGIAAVIAMGFIGKWLIESRAQSLSLTNERLIYRYGIVQRETSELRHDDVRNVKLDQNVVERLLNFGDIAISSSGQDEMEIVIHDIPSPKNVIEFIRKRQ